VKIGDITQACGGVALCYTAVLSRNAAESDNSAGKGRGSNAVPSPHPCPAWRINEMTSTEKSSVNLYEPRAVSRDGFRIKNAAGVATANRLNKGVYPIGM
jgi:hypothetical protein